MYSIVLMIFIFNYKTCVLHVHVLYSKGINVLKMFMEGEGGGSLDSQDYFYL